MYLQGGGCARNRSTPHICVFGLCRSLRSFAPTPFASHRAHVPEYQGCDMPFHPWHQVHLLLMVKREKFNKLSFPQPFVITRAWEVRVADSRVDIRYLGGWSVSHSRRRALPAAAVFGDGRSGERRGGGDWAGGLPCSKTRLIATDALEAIIK